MRMTGHPPPEGDWSLVVTSIDGNLIHVEARFRHILRWTGISAYTLWEHAGGPARLPAELLHRVTQARAEHAAGLLAPVGVVCEVRPSDSAESLTTRAADLWAHRAFGRHHRFSEVDGLIGKGAPIHLREAISRAGGPEVGGWQLERSFNHNHPAGSRHSARRQLQICWESASELAEALGAAWPERSFVVTSWLGENLVSFFQPTEGVPVPQLSPLRRGPDRAFCDSCQAAKPCFPRTEPDAEFPDVLWGDCQACGREVVVRGRERLTLVRGRVTTPVQIPDTLP